MNPEIAYLYDAAGNLLAVQISPALWQCLQAFAEAAPPAPQAEDDLAAFHEFLDAWNFRYAYDPAVRCPACNAQTSDWRNDAGRPFILKNANIGGLLVFACRNCGATVRQKFFKTHMACEHTPAQA